MSKDQTDFEEIVRAAERTRIQAVKAAKQILNATIRTSYIEVIERAWSAYDDAVRESWRVHDAVIEAADGNKIAKQPCAMTDSVLERPTTHRDNTYHMLNE